MPSIVHVHFLPSLVEPEHLAGAAVVVIDVLRASTTIVHAIAAGAEAVIPCLDVAEARRVAANLPAGTAVLAGERGCLKVEGFDLGNSPSEYTPETVGGKTVVFTTTNGTRAMQNCRLAKKIFIGAFVNRHALIQEIVHESVLHFLCAGTDGEITLEDVLFAGALFEGITDPPYGPRNFNDQAFLALRFWNGETADELDDPQRLRNIIEGVLGISRGNRNLIQHGLQSDTKIAAQLDQFQVVPELDLQSWRIRSR